MKVALVGLNGQLAQSLQNAPCPASIEIEPIGRPDIDLAAPGTIAPALSGQGFDCVVNAAAYTAVDKAESEPDLATAINATAPGVLADRCNEAGVPLVHVSTDYVFDGTKDAPYIEADPVAPLGVYGQSKLAGEQAIAAALPEHVILRTAWLFSPYGDNFVKTMLRLAGDRDSLNVITDQQGCPTYAPHLADGIVRILERIATARDDVQWGVYHAAGQGETTWCDLSRAVFEESARHGGPTATVTGIITAEYPTPAKRPANSRLNSSRLGEAFGVTLPHWQEGVRACVGELLSGREPAPQAS